MPEFKYLDGKVVGGPTATAPFGLAVNMGLCPEMFTVPIYGVNRMVEPGTVPEDLWEYGGTYTYDAFGTAPIRYVSSSSAADTGQLIQLDGLDINGDWVVQYVTTQGQAAVEIDTPLYRINIVTNASSQDIAGTLYVGTQATPVAGVPSAANVRAIINGNHNKSLMSLYTVPKGYVAFLLRGAFAMQYESLPSAGAQYLTGHFEARKLGGVLIVFREVTLITTGSTTYEENRPTPEPLTGLTDMKIKITDCTDDMSAWGELDLLIVKEDYLSEALLRKLAQPGFYY